MVMPAMAAPGDLDPTFDGDGIVITDVSGVSDFPANVAIQSDGKIVVSGDTIVGSEYDVLCMRYNSDGSLDPSFSGDGVASWGGDGRDGSCGLAIQEDRKIVLAGWTTITSNYDFAVLRYNLDGSLDTDFSGDGIVTLASGDGDDVGISVKVQSDGKIVVVGYTWNGTNDDFAILRFNSDGSLDSSFSDDGILTLDIGNADNSFSDVVIQPDGKIAALGYTWGGSDEDFVVVRFNNDGTIDTSFSEDGIVITDVGNTDNYIAGEWFSSLMAKS